MKLEQQVCSLELAKKLKSLNVKQESFWHWCLSIGKKSGEEVWCLYPLLGFSNHNAPSGRTHKYIYDEDYSAFTVAELYKLHHDKFGSCYVRSKIRPEYLADYLAESYINNLQSEG